MNERHLFLPSSLKVARMNVKVDKKGSRRPCVAEEINTGQKEIRTCFGGYFVYYTKVKTQKSYEPK
jgi:hypothetical protein